MTYDTTAMILAAGLGTRLGALTQDKPKALVELNGKPLLQHCIENLITNGFHHIVINVHHFGEQIIDFVKSHHFDAEIQISDERDLLMDTGGGIVKATPLFQKSKAVLVHNVDIISDVNLYELSQQFLASGDDAWLLTQDRETNRKLLFRNDNQLIGWRNKADGNFKWVYDSFGEYQEMAFSGLHFFRSDLFANFEVKRSSVIDLYLQLAKTNRIISKPIQPKFWFDLGKPEQLQLAEQQLKTNNMSQDSFIHRIYEHIQSHYNIDNEELTIVFPNKRAAYYLRTEFCKNYSKPSWLPQMLSIEEAVTHWSGITMVDNIDILFELIDINAQLHTEQNSSLSVFGSQAAQMAKDFDEIDQYGVNAQHVFNYIVENEKLGIWNFDEAKMKDKEQKYLNLFKSLYDYYLQLRNRLSAQGKGYYGMITRYLSELSETELLEKVGNRKLVFAGFNALTTTEESIINKLVRNGKAEIIFDYDSYYLDDPNNQAGFFARRYRIAHPDWLKNGISDTLCNEAKSIHIIKASGNTLQAKALQAKLQETGNANQAVILADESLLIPMLNAIPETDNFNNIKVSMGYPIGKTSVNQLIKGFLTLHRRGKITREISESGVKHTVDGWYIWSVLNIMDLEIVKILFTKEEIIAFSHWKNDSVRKGKFIFETNDLEELRHLPNIQAFLKVILAEANENDPKAILHGISQVLHFITKTLQGEQKPLFLLNQVSEIGKVVSRLGQVIDRNKKYINDIQCIETLYHLLSSGVSVKLKNNDTEGLQVMGLLETRNLSFDRLHVLSVNEGILPTEKSLGSFIPPFIRRECGLPSYTETQAIIAYHFYHLLQSSKKIYLYYNNLGETFGGEASRYILQIKHELAKNANISITEEEFSSKAKPSLDVESLSITKADSIEQLRHFIENDGIAPTTLSVYLQCPLKFYLNFIARIKDKSIQEDLGFNILGNIIHDTLEFLFKPYCPTDGDQQIIDKALFDNVIQPQWEQMLERAIKKHLPNGFPDVGFNFLNKVTIKQQLTNYLKYTSKQLENNTLCFLEAEGELRTILSTQSGNCLFKGRTDRIDRMGNLIRVIDYKTGSVKDTDLKVPVRHYSESDLDYLKKIPEKALQLLMYQYLYLKEHTNLSPEQVTGAIHALKYANNIEFRLAKATPSKNDTDANIAFLDDNNLIPDMEAMLEAVVAEMLDPEILFKQTEDDKKCRNCEFKEICKR